MINKAIREHINSINGDAMFLDAPSFDNSIIGMSQKSQIIYDFDKMVDEYLQDNNIIDEDLAVEYILTDTLKSIEYMGVYAPIILFHQDIS